MDCFLIAQILGFLALVSSILSVMQKSRGKYIVFNIVQNIFSAFQYLLLSKNIAFYLCLIAIIRLVVYSFRRRFNKITNIFVLVFFIVLNLFVSIINFKYWYDLIPLIASTLVCYTVWQKEINIIRLGVLISKAMWGVFAIISLAYFSVIMDVFIIVWTFVLLVGENKRRVNFN